MCAFFHAGPSHDCALYVSTMTTHTHAQAHADSLQQVVLGNTNDVTPQNLCANV